MRGVGRAVRAAPGDDGVVEILRDLDFVVERGGIAHVVGPSGSGKTSLLRLVNRLDESTGGTIEVLGRPIDAWPVRDLRRRVAMVFQEPSLLGLSVGANLRLPFELHGRVTPAEMDAAIERAMTLAGADAAWLDRDAARLSTGQKQRVSLARALAAGPDILLLDEPTAALDPRTAEQLLERLDGLCRAGTMTIIMSTHRIDEARRLGGTMLVLMEGRVAASGPVGELLADPSAPEVRAFFEREAGRG